MLLFHVLSISGVKQMYKSLMLLSVAAIAFFSCDAVVAQGRTFNVSVRNNWDRTVRIKRMAEGERDHASVDLQQNGSQTFRIQFDSDQVFMAWSQGRLLGVQRFELQNAGNLGGLSITITDQGTMSIAVSSR